jgi:hypothetical protein
LPGAAQATPTVPSGKGDVAVTGAISLTSKGVPRSRRPSGSG